MHDVDKVLSTHMLSESTTTKESDENELAENQAGFDLNMEEFSSDFNASVFQDSHMENDGTIPETQVQNVQEKTFLMIMNKTFHLLTICLQILKHLDMLKDTHIKKLEILRRTESY